MRRLILVVLLASLVPFAGAAKRVTVAQMEQALTAARAQIRPRYCAATWRLGAFRTADRGDAQAAYNGSWCGLPGDAGLHLLADQSSFWTRRRTSCSPLRLPTAQLSSG